MPDELRVIAFEPERLLIWEPTPGDVVASRAAELPVGASQGYTWGFRLQPDGDATQVTEVFDCTDAAQSIRDAVRDGQNWVPVMGLGAPAQGIVRRVTFIDGTQLAPSELDSCRATWVMPPPVSVTVHRVRREQTQRRAN